jgi:hypothetical protein
VAQKGIVDNNLRNLLLHLSERKQLAGENRAKGSQVAWMRPPLGPRWDGDLSTQAGLIALHSAFNTDQAEEALISAHDPDNPGNTGDDIALPLQIDYAAQAERAYRARATMSFPRMLAHVAGRERGHGAPNGVLAAGLLRYVDDILLQAADGAGGDV